MVRFRPFLSTVLTRAASLSFSRLDPPSRLPTEPSCAPSFPLPFCHCVYVIAAGILHELVALFLPSIIFPGAGTGPYGCDSPWPGLRPGFHDPTTRHGFSVISCALRSARLVRRNIVSQATTNAALFGQGMYEAFTYHRILTPNPYQSLGTIRWLPLASR